MKGFVWACKNRSTFQVLFVTLTLFLFVGMSNCNATTELNKDEKSTQNISMKLNGHFLTLNLNSAVKLPKENIKTYMLSPLKPNHEVWNKAIFGAESHKATSIYDQTDPDGFPILKASEEYDYKNGYTWCWYSSRNGRLMIRLSNKNFLVDWNPVYMDKQAIGINLSPDRAKDLSQSFLRSLGIDDVIITHSYAMPPAIENSDPNKGFYIVEFMRKIDEIPCAFDVLSYTVPQLENSKNERLAVLVDDQGIHRVDGYYRKIDNSQDVQLTISLNEAIEILSKNMDYVRVYNDSRYFEIQEIGFYYIAISDAESGIGKLHPVWRFASGVSHNNTDVFVMYISAITGKVLSL